jgi:hypothetical protein
MSQSKCSNCVVRECRGILQSRAGSAVSSAIKTGELRPSACERLDENCKGRIEAHHEDYNKPLDVMWLCLIHHHQRHSETRNVDCASCIDKYGRNPERVVSEKKVEEKEIPCQIAPTVKGKKYLIFSGICNNCADRMSGVLEGRESPVKFRCFACDNPFSLADGVRMERPPAAEMAAMDRQEAQAAEKGVTK